MLTWFYPDFYIESAFHLPIAQLKAMGIRALVFDIDNTLAPYDCPLPDERVHDLFSLLEEEQILSCVLSNNKQERAEAFCQNLPAIGIGRSQKPLPFVMKKAMKTMGVSPKETAIIGDQLFTDILCGRLAGATTILTKPLCNRDQWITKIKRKPESFLLHHYEKWREEHHG